MHLRARRSAKPIQLLLLRSRGRSAHDPGWRHDLHEARRLHAELGSRASLARVVRAAEERWRRVSLSHARAAQAMGFYTWAHEVRGYLGCPPAERSAHHLHRVVRGVPGLRLR